MGHFFSRSEQARLEAPAIEGVEGEPRILAYCASNVGMGHFGEISRIMKRVREILPRSSALLASDIRGKVASTVENMAWLRLPGFHFDDPRSFTETPEFLSISAKELQRVRTQILLSTAVSFQPQVLLMVTNPHGKRDEMLPVLRHLRSCGRATRAILIMRDIPVPPEEKFKLNGSQKEILKHAAYYDRILISGDAHFFNAPEVYQWPSEVREKMRFAGFIVPRREDSTRREAFEPFPRLDPSKNLICCGFGGGWEVASLAPKLIEGFRRYSEGKDRNAQLALFTGTAVDAEDYERIERMAAETPGVEVRMFTPHFPALLSHCDMAILQSGSTPFQILESNIPMVLHFRDYKSAEQETRARLLARYPGIRLLEREELAGGDCAEWMEWALDQTHPERKTGMAFNGIETAANEVLAAVEAVQGS